MAFPVSTVFNTTSTSKVLRSFFFLTLGACVARTVCTEGEKGFILSGGSEISSIFSTAYRFESTIDLDLAVTPPLLGLRQNPDCPWPPPGVAERQWVPQLEQHERS